MTPPHRHDVSSRHEASVTLDPALESPTTARRFAVARLQEWGVGALVADVELAVSELVRNAVEHTGTTCTLTLSLAPGCLRVEVHDGDPHLPSVQQAAPMDLSGRGLLLVRALAAGWGAEPRPGGKVVWCEIDVPADGPQPVPPPGR
jgi:anti-sigma regulatory factor (Ser/Thr protein kinase)